MVRVLRTRPIYCLSARLPINSGSGDMSLVVFSLVNAKDHWRNPSRPVVVLRGGWRGAYAPPNRLAGAMLCSHNLHGTTIANRM